MEVSLIYRFGLAGLIILTFCLLTQRSIMFTLQQHLYMALLGLLNFCLNYVTLYQAQNYLTSAVTSIGFSTLLLFNIVNTRIFFGKAIPPRTYVGAIIGISGIVVLFWQEIIHYQSTSDTLKGALLILTGVIFASFGNMVSVRNSNHQFPILQSSGWAMIYGTLFLFAFALINGVNFTVSAKPSYLLSLAYLTIFGSIIAFYSYFMLLKTIGPEKASYSIVLFPVVAVLLSTIFEDFKWTEYTVMGFLLVATGNILVLTPISKIKSMFSNLAQKCMVKESE